MAFRYSPKIITDGLHFSIDPANHKSYPGSGTSVSDLVARNTSPTLENGAGYSSINGGVFSFDGIDDFLLISNNGQSSGFNTAEYTVEIWVYVNSTSTANTPIWSYDYTSHSVHLIMHNILDIPMLMMLEHEDILQHGMIMVHILVVDLVLICKVQMEVG
jgi:hypothetical protein